MNGTNSLTGKPLGGIEHLHQSIRDILTTPLGSRVMRPGYGSRLLALVDRPMNAQTLLQLYAATAQAIQRHEPRLKVTRVYAKSARPGVVEIVMDGVYLPDGKQITLDGIVIK